MYLGFVMNGDTYYTQVKKSDYYIANWFTFAGKTYTKMGSEESLNLTASDIPNITKLAGWVQTSGYETMNIDNIEYFIPTGPTEPTTPTTQPIDTNIEMTTLEGASIRLNERSGLRFYTEVDKDKVLQLKDAGYTVELGTLIAPYDLLGENELSFDLENGKYTDVKYTSQEYYEEGTFSGIVGSIVSIKEKTKQNQKSGNILRYFVARGYAKVTDSENNTTIVYADYNKASPRSLGFVAYMFKNDNQNSALYLSNAEKVDKWASLYEEAFDPESDDLWS